MNIIQWNGEPVTEPGIYAGVPLEVYHTTWTAEPSVSTSGLKTLFWKSPAHYWDGSPYNPDREEPKDSEPKLLGRAAHHLLLGEADFRRHFVIRPDTYVGEGKTKPWSNNANWCRAWNAQQAAAGLSIVTSAQVERIKGMATSLARDPLVKAGLLSGLIEHSFLWRDPETGVLLRWRPDALPQDSLAFGDLKCVADVSYEAVERSISDFGYNMQGALGRRACMALLGRPMESFTLACIESSRPHCTAIKTITDEAMNTGERQIAAAVRMFARGIETGRWPGPAGEQRDAEYVGLTPWAEKKIETRLAMIEQELKAA